MKTFRVREVGRMTHQDIQAQNAIHAVAEAAGCDLTQVCLPIWEQLDRRALDRTPTESCFMPLDNTGRQWIVAYPKGS